MTAAPGTHLVGLMSRFWLIPLLLALMVVGPFLIWGEAMANLLWIDPETGQASAGQGVFWAVAIGLLIADIFIPVPTTSILAALGIVYGPALGAVIGVAGTMSAAAAGYAFGRFLGRPVAARFLGASIEGGERIFKRHGGWIVALSRWAPVLPEVVSVVAGVSRMPVAAFLLAALCGVVPFCIVFALVGHLGAEQPIWTLVISAVAPFALWWLARRVGLTKRFDLELDG
ncbi:MAG: VTT domain-containing protein [Pseudomonadota bacterium]